MTSETPSTGKTSRVLGVSDVRIARLIAVLLIVGLIGGGCRRRVVDGTAEPAIEERIISQILTTDDDLVYDVRWFPTGCERLERVDVDESDEEVSFTVWTFVNTADCESSTGESSVLVTLDEPVGDRVVFDGNLDTTVALNSPAQPPEDLDG